jgi:hypothetical protein
MRQGSGFLIIVFGFVILYLALSDKFDCLVQFLNCIAGSSSTNTSVSGSAPMSDRPRRVFGSGGIAIPNLTPFKGRK